MKGPCNVAEVSLYAIKALKAGWETENVECALYGAAYKCGSRLAPRREDVYWNDADGSDDGES